MWLNDEKLSIVIFDGHLCIAKFILTKVCISFFHLNDQAFESGKKMFVTMYYLLWFLKTWKKNLVNLRSFQQSSSFRNIKKISSNIYVAEISQSLNLIYSLLESGESSAWGYTTIPTIEFTQDFNSGWTFKVQNLTTDKNGWNPIWILTFYQNY